MTAIEELQKLDRLAREEGRRYVKYRRPFVEVLSQKGKVFHAFLGSRGVGKTILLKQLLNEIPDSFYISVDTLEEDEDLFSLIENVSKNFKIRCFLLDEVHYISNIDAYLKKIFDFLNVQIIFTSSISLLMYESAHDLSRRVRLYPVHALSFREYLYLSGKSNEMNMLTLQDIVSGNYSAEYLRWEDSFTDYLKGGILPYALEATNPLPLLKNIIKKIIEKDIPRVASLKIEELRMIEKLLTFIGKSTIDGINPNSLSQNLAITKYKAEQYTVLLERAFVLKQLLPSGTNVLREPKIVLSPPYRLLYSKYNEAVGGLREDFTCEMLMGAGLEFYYLKDMRGEKCPDFLVHAGNKQLVVEVGGRGKGSTQFKGVKADVQRLIFAHGGAHSPNSRSLALLGFLY